MFKNGNLMKKMVVLGVCVCVFATGCQGVEKESQNGGNVTGQETQKPETSKPEASDKKAEVYYETKVDLGQKTASDIRLTAESDAVSGKKFYVDGEEIDLSAKENLKTENCQHVNVFTEDIDQDGTKDIIVAFYGGAGGTFQQFCMMKRWHCSSKRQWNKLRVEVQLCLRNIREKNYTHIFFPLSVSEM